MPKGHSLSKPLIVLVLLSKIILTASPSVAKPVLNRPVAFSRSNLVTVYPDSEDNNRYFYLPQVYEYCPLKNRFPDFKMKIEKNAEIPYAILQFHLCPESDMAAVLTARNELQARQSLATLSPIDVDELEIGKLPQTIPANLPMNFTCKAFDQGGSFKEASCLIVVAGDTGIDTAAQEFLHTTNVIVSGTFQRVVAGVQYVEKKGRYKPVIKRIPVTYRVIGVLH